MPKPKRTKKRKGKIRVITGAKVVKKDSIRNDMFPKAPTRTTLPTNGITFKVKVRKK